MNQLGWNPDLAISSDMEIMLLLLLLLARRSVIEKRKPLQTVISSLSPKLLPAMWLTNLGLTKDPTRHTPQYLPIPLPLSRRASYTIHG